MVDIYEQNPLQRLYAAGQSVWYDNIRRGVVLHGELEAMVAGDAVTGITSNPTIFHKAVTASAGTTRPSPTWRARGSRRRRWWIS